MISIRRLIASILAGGLLILVSAAQASAQAPASLERAFDGVGRGLAAVAELVGNDVVEVDESLLEAFDAYAAWVERHETSGREGHGQGPVNAAEVHRALRDGVIPGQMEKVDGSKLGELAGVYENLKGKSDVAKAAKEQKDKSGKGNSRSDDAKGSAPGQSNRP